MLPYLGSDFSNNVHNIHGINIEIAEAQRQFHGDQKYHAKHVLRKIPHSKAERGAKQRLKEEIEQLDQRLEQSERKLRSMEKHKEQANLDKLEEELQRKLATLSLSR